MFKLHKPRLSEQGPPSIYDLVSVPGRVPVPLPFPPISFYRSLIEPDCIPFCFPLPSLPPLSLLWVAPLANMFGKPNPNFVLLWVPISLPLPSPSQVRSDTMCAFALARMSGWVCLCSGISVDKKILEKVIIVPQVRVVEGRSHVNVPLIFYYFLMVTIEGMLTFLGFIQI